VSQTKEVFIACRILVKTWTTLFLGKPLAFAEQFLHGILENGRRIAQS
jgi:hypothetical protein